ncbi:MAG: nuclear transport factor 2 family protein [Saprospiraceae bacterium]|nr:nuclear transport factor 2 family protein [Saprospiraceae bacterium]
MRCVTLPVCLLLVFVASCLQQGTPAYDPDVVVDEVQATLEAYFDATREHGIFAGLEYLDTSQQFFWVPPGFQSALSRDSVTKILTVMAPAIGSISNQWQNLTVYALGPDHATFTGRVHSRATDTSGTTSHSQLLESGVMVRRDDGWKLLCGQTRIMQN